MQPGPDQAQAAADLQDAAAGFKDRLDHGPLEVPAFLQLAELARETGSLTRMPLPVTHGQLEAILVLDHRVVIDQAAIPAFHRGDGEAPFPALGHQRGVIVLTERAKDISHGVSSLP